MKSDGGGGQIENTKELYDVSFISPCISYPKSLGGLCDRIANISTVSVLVPLLISILGEGGGVVWYM